MIGGTETSPERRSRSLAVSCLNRRNGLRILVGMTVLLLLSHALYVFQSYERIGVSGGEFGYVAEDQAAVSAGGDGGGDGGDDGGLSGPEQPARKAMVVASMPDDDIAHWYDFFPDWEINMYDMAGNESSAAPSGLARLAVPENKGHESMAYLTYIVDNYHDLPDVVVFQHAERYQWHNDDPMYDGVPVLKNLRLQYVQEVGYANLRCSWTLGCPASLHPIKRSPLQNIKLAFLQLSPSWPEDHLRTIAAYADSFGELFPDTAVPDPVGAPCGGQFAVSKWQILQRGLDDYERYRQWLLDTPLQDSISGRIFEYSWHMIMGMPAVYCPPAGECFCKKFGQCNLNCTDGSCQGYTFPPHASIPSDWPLNGPATNGSPGLTV